MSHKAIIAGIAVAMALVVGFILYPEQPPPVDPVWEAELQTKSEEMNKNLPSLIDEETALTVTAAKGNTLEFRHTFLNLQKEDIDVDATGDELYPALRANACTSAETTIYRDHGTTLQYVYYDKDGDYVFGFKIETRDCQ